MSIHHRRWFIVQTLGAVALGAPQIGKASLRDTINHLTGKAGTLRIATVDVSASPQSSDRTALYRDGIQQYVAQASSGDTLLLAFVGNDGLGSEQFFRFPVPSTGKSLEDRRLKLEVSKNVLSMVEQRLAKPGVMGSRFIEMFAALRPEVASAAKQGMGVTLVNFGDQLESSAIADFESPRFTDTVSTALVQKLVQQGMLIASGDIPSFNVYAVGAGGRTPETFLRVERFWRNYFKTAGATLHYYGRSVPSFSFTKS